jgi:hypothetical protein
VKTFTLSMAPPAHVAAHLVGRVKAAALDQALCQAQRHGSVVGPLPGMQAERPGAGHVPHGGEASRELELHRRANRIPRG